MQNCEKRILASSCLSVRSSVRPHGTTQLPLDGFSRNLMIFRKLSRQFKFHSNQTKTTCTLHKDQYTFSITSRTFLLRMRNVSDKRCRENQNTHFVTLFRKSCHLRDNVGKIVERGTPKMTIWHMHIACWISKATNTDSDCVILIALSLQQWLHKSTSTLRYTYIACLLITGLGFVYCAVRAEYI